MTSDIGLLVACDPAVWLAGPTEPAVAADWVVGALDACARDFEVKIGSPEHDYLAELLQEFAHRELATGNRFLRLRGIEDAPLVALLDVYVGRDEHEVADAFADVDPEERLYDPPVVEVIDEARGLRRSVRFVMGDTISSTVRYHRRVDDLGVDVLMSCSGADLVATAAGLPDLDALARSVWIITSDGDRR